MKRACSWCMAVLFLFGGMLTHVEAQDSLSADSVLQRHMDQGLAYANEGKYDLALMQYQQALDLEPKNAFVNYEMAHAHFELGNKSKARKYAHKVAKDDADFGVQGIILEGTVWDDLGKPKKAIKTFDRGIKRFGDYYLLHYNKGVTAFANADFEVAEAAFVAAIYCKLDHADSHLSLARTMSAQGRITQTLYPLYFYLLLQPNAEVAPLLIDRVKTLQAHPDSVIQRLSKSKKKERVYPLDDVMRTADMLFLAFYASRSLERYNDWSEEQIDREILGALFLEINRIDFRDRSDLYVNYYIPFFGAIAKEGYMEACYHFMHQAASAASAQWVEENFTAVEAFFTWLDEDAPDLNEQP